MTIDITAVPRREQYTGSAGTGPYQFDFEVLEQADIAVYKNSTLLTLTTDYTVTINGDGTGSVTLVSAATGSDLITIIGARPIARTTDFVTGGDLLANSLNDELDSLVIFAQQLLETQDRTFRFAPSADITGVDLQLPAPSAGKAIKWNSGGTALENSAFDPDTYAASAAASASTATTQAGIATTQAGIATSEANLAEAARLAAEAAQTNAETAETNAETAEANAEAAASAVGTQFTFDAGTSMADPGTGDFRFNNASAGATTAIAVSALTSEAGNADVSAFVATWAGSTNTIKGYITLKKSAAPATFAVFSVSSVTDNGTWLQLGVTHVASNGTWSAADVAYMAFTRAGDKGTDGTGDLTGQSASVDNEIALFSGTGGKTIKRATTTGVLKATSGVIAAATAGTDYVAPGTVTTFTASQRGTVTTDNDLSFDMNAANNFSCTPTAGGTLTFTNITAGQSGFILLVNGSNYAIAAHTNTKVGTSTLTTISATGTYLLSYFSDGTNVYIVNSGSLS